MNILDEIRSLQGDVSDLNLRLSGVRGAAISTLTKDITSYADSPMIVTGGALSNGTNAGTLKVGILTALLRKAASDTAALEKASLAEQDNVVIPAADTFYHIVLTSAPAISIQVASANGTTEIGIGSVMKEVDDTVHFAEAGMRLQNGVAKIQRRAAALRYIELASGCVITETGGALTLGISSGIAYEGLCRFTPFSGGAFDSNVADNFTRIYRDGGGGYTKQAAQTVIDSDHYDDNSGGVALVTVNQYSVHWVYLHPDDEHVYVVYGRDSFKLAEAITEQPYGDLPDYIAEFGVLLGKIITKKGTAIFDDVQMVTDTFFVGTAATIHGNLGGLDVVGDHNWSGTKTTAAWNKSIGAAGDYATWAAMIADMPDLIAHAVTVTIKTGTTLTETCNLKNKHGLTADAAITIQAEDYFPQSGAIPTASSATVTTLVDSAQAWAIDRFIDCWVFVVHGTGTDNGFVKITDSNATSVTVASWPGTQPDNTSRYLIVGTLIDGEGARGYGLIASSSTVSLYFKGIGEKDATSIGLYFNLCNYVSIYYCGVFNNSNSGIYFSSCFTGNCCYLGIVKNNTNNSASHAGFNSIITQNYIANSGISDNNQRGVYNQSLGYFTMVNNFGDGNGNWGSYTQYSAQSRIAGTECSGSAGNHSDPGTAGNANADQAAAY